VFFALFMVCVAQLVLATLLLLSVGGRLHRGWRPAGVVLVAALTIAAGWSASHVWGISGAPLIAASVIEVVCGVSVVAARPVWNPIGQAFLGAYISAALSYLAFAAYVTVADGLSFLASLASAMLLVLESAALVLSASFAFETCDVLCRSRRDRPLPTHETTYKPFVSLHIPAYNEPPDMLIRTVEAAAAIDYPDFEVVVIDNNTPDPATWMPVAEHFRYHPKVTFVHVDQLEGYKSGALNLALNRYTSEQAELIGVIDADYLVSPDYLKATVGYFADPRLAFLQTPQDYRDYDTSGYFRACYDAYRYFFSMAMPSRNERDSAIFAGTMGLLRRQPLEALGGWDQWCVTEDAETSLRMLRAGYSGLFIPRSFGKGIMPLTFASLKSQRYRWCFGGMQILRKHCRSLRPWDSDPDNHLSIGQRLDYLFGGLQWLNDLVYLGFTLVLLVVAGLLLAGDHIPIRPFIGPTVLLPAALLSTGLLRAVWALRKRDHLSYTRAFLAFISWLSLSLTVARACVSGLLRSEGAFLRTPKTGSVRKLRAALAAAAPESLLAVLLLGLGAALAITTASSFLVIALVLWQGSVYLAAPVMSRLNQLAHLTPELERRRRSEERRERLTRFARGMGLGSALAGAGGAAVFVLVLALGATHPGHPSNPLRFPSGGSGQARLNKPARNHLHHPAKPSTTSSSSSTSSSTTSTTSTTSSSTTTTTSSSTTVPTSSTTVPTSSTTSPSSTTSTRPGTTRPGTTRPGTTTPVG
jgi:cellulose synthase/poly-beta-1,6-N-acetylglucosamine synthase-like glycosyltransferase